MTYNLKHFSDTLTISYHDDNNGWRDISLLKNKISWSTDRSRKFDNPEPKDRLQEGKGVKKFNF